jgi:hypothetical protein
MLRPPSKADIRAANGHVRFTPKSGHCLIQHLVGERDQRGRHGEAKGLGGLQANYEIKFGGLHDRQVG